ncbi:hypothetical protein [Alkalimarinus sediminis]|uniref:Uncharacterized protein n=1 Tax=Alkalimarinus sediminis TaxID=1632866 RepID=A0A9E8KRV9_9ALTE|nr:hypothetical protein [Alkalimarinus sediminis]UZW76642.1 hypothetical protein NNL22_08680 [Alkalimarinus sediminis]
MKYSTGKPSTARAEALIQTLKTLCLLTLLFCVPVYAQMNVPADKLHWDDIPNWEHAKGKVSRAYIQHSDWHAVTLQPKASVTYRIPRNAFTRLVSDSSEQANNIMLSRGDGNGLFSPITQVNKIDSSLLIMPESHYWQLLIHNSDDKPATLSVMTSRKTGQKSIPLARELIAPNNSQTGWITTPHLSQRDNYAYANGVSSISYSVEGPLFVEVESLLLETAIDENLPSYLINTQLDGKPWQQWQHHAAHYPFIRRSSDLPNADQSETTEFKTSTYTEKYYLQIPEGQHTLSFRSYRPIALRLFKDSPWGLLGNEDFLYPKLKEHQQRQIDYQLGLNRLIDSLLSHPPAEADQLLGRWRDQHTFLKSIQERSVNRLQFYRPLTASTVSTPPLNLLNLNSVVAKYKSIQEHPALLDNEANDNDSKSAFTELSANQQASFSLPPLSGPTTLRVRIADLNDQNASFLLTNQKGETNTIIYRPEFRSKLLNSATEQLKAGETATTETFIPLSSSTTTLTVKSLAKATSKLQLAYLTTHKPKISANELSNLLNQLSENKRADIVAFLQGRYQEPKEEPSERINERLMQLSLSNLAHRVQVRSKQFEQATPTLDPRLLSNSPVPVRWQETVASLAEQHSWAKAIEIVTPLAMHQDITIRIPAAKVLSALLLKSGEFFLYEQWLLKVIKSPAYIDYINDAEQALVNRYKAQGRMGSLEKLSAYRFNQSADIRYLKLMGDSLSHESSLALRQTIDATYSALATQQNTVDSSQRLSTAQTTLTAPSRLWQTVESGAFTSASSMLLYGHALDSYSYRLTANPSQPLLFTVEGPTRLAVSYRTLLTQGEQKSQNSWITLRDNQHAHHIPTFSSPQSNEVSLVGSENKLSVEQRFEYQVGEGTHQIELRPEHGDMAIGLSTRSSDATNINRLAVNDPQHPLSLTDHDINSSLALNSQNETAASNNATKTILRLIWAIEHPQQGDANQKNEAAESEGLSSTNQLSSTSQLPSTDKLSLIAKGNHLIQQQAKSPLLNRLSIRLNKFTTWRLEQQLIDSAGKRYIQFEQAPISNPKTQIRRSLSGQQDTSSQWLSAFNDSNISINSSNPIELKLELKQLLPTNAYTTDGATVKIWLNQKPYQDVSLTPNNQFKTLALSLKAGNHQLRLAMLNAKSEQQVVFRAFRKTTKNQWALIENPVKQAYSVSLKDNPVKVFAAASQWLRIDDIENGHVSSSYYFQQESGILTLLPKPGQAERLIRVYTLQSKPNSIELPASTPPIHLAPAPPTPYQPVAREWVFEDNLELGEENEGTWGGYLKFTNKASSEDTDSDEDDINTSLNAFQVGHLYRKKLNDDRYWSTPTGDWHSDAYWKSDTFLRHTNDSGNTLGTEQRYMLADPLTDWRLSLKAKAQYFQADNGLSDDVLNVYTDAQYRHDWQFNRQQSLYASLTGFVRYLDNDDPNGPDSIDPLVYSDYKRDHLYGWRLAGLWRYRLWQDSRLNVGTKIISNEKLSTLDQMSVQAGYQQYFKGLTGALAFRHIQRFSDDDRQKSSQQNELKGSLRFHQWNSAGHEWYGALDLTHNMTEKDNAVALTFGFNHSDGRGVTDYLPTVLPMRGLYQQQSTQQQKMNTQSDQPSL